VHQPAKVNIPLSADHYLPSRPAEVCWGWLPNAASKPVMTLQSGQSVCIDTISHEGLLEDQGRDPIGFFESLGIAASDVLTDVQELSQSKAFHDPMILGPHVVTGPIAISGARPGDVLEVEVLSLERRCSYGIISNRHGKGALPGELPLGDQPGPVSLLAYVHDELGVLPVGDGRDIRFPLNPFLGIMGVAPNTEKIVHSVPPGPHGGNLDVNLFGVGSHLFLPIQVPGAMFYVGDPHFAQGDGEVALTAFEAPLRATLRLTLRSNVSMRTLAARLTNPWGRTAEHDVLIGLDVDLGAAMRDCTRNALAFLELECNIPPSVALAYLSAAADFEVSQVVDQVQGIHCCIRSADIAQLRIPSREF
jgi:acetamidase/formamidase